MLFRQQPPGSTALAASYAACERLARNHYENFPVASHLLPRAMRPHVAAVYAFARIADDFADEGDRPVAERQESLDAWLERLSQAVTARVAMRSASRATHNPPDPYAPLFLALGNTIHECGLPVGLFEDLVSAFRQDTTTTRYETFEDVLDYCRRSANPVGRLVLRIAGYRDDRADAASDCVCTALQLTNFWQDFARDWQRGRLYAPLADVRAAGACERDLDCGHLTREWRHVLSTMANRTADLFLRGREIPDLVHGRLRFELRLTWLGGWRILERLQAEQFDVFAERPALGARDLPLLAWRAFRWRAACPRPGGASSSAS